jgi:hypothetical protein
VADKKDELKPDTVLKNYWRQKDEFADFFNAYLFEGREILKADELVEKDTDSSAVFEVDDADISIQAARDLLKVVMSYNGVEYAILGLENQDYIHYALPFKIDGYDVYSYDRQYKEKKAHYKATKELSGDERMSGIKKTDRFTPVVTVVIYYGSEPWDGPTCLYDMLDLPEELKPFITNYKVNLVEARDNNLIFHNQNNKDLFSLLRIIYDDSTDRRVRREQIAQYESDRNIDKSVCMAVAATSRVDLKEYEKEADAIVCNLWDEVRAEGKEEGKEEGIFETLFGLVKDGILTVSEAAKRANMTEASFTEHMEKFKA